MAATAEAENACAETSTLRVSVPSPSTFTRPRLCTRPASRRVSGLTVPAPSRSRASRLTTVYSTRNGFLKPPSFGSLWASGSWPPSKPTLELSRARAPLVPRPAVLPPLPAVPRPTLRRGRLDPGAGCSSWGFTGLPPRFGWLFGGGPALGQLLGLGHLRALGWLRGLGHLRARRAGLPDGAACAQPRYEGRPAPPPPNGGLARACPLFQAGRVGRWNFLYGRGRERATYQRAKSPSSALALLAVVLALAGITQPRSAREAHALSPCRPEALQLG